MHTIVVIEDQPVLASAYRNKFQSEGFIVEVALDGEQGLDLITRIKPDLVLLDMHLPKLSGLEILKRVRSDQQFQELPIIVFSNLTKPGAVEEAWQAGATKVLSKFNTSPKRVLESVQSILATDPSHAFRRPLTTVADLIPASNLQSTDGQSAGGNVLLVEDHSDMSTLLTFLLHQAGHQVTSATSHRAALQHIDKQSFDLFLLGHGCTDGDGLSLCKQFRQSRPNTPVIVYSTAALFLEQQAGLKAGVAAYLVKPEDLLNLGQIVSGLLPRLAPAESIKRVA
jgi:CheY-like chemotaxis protein